MPHQFKLFNCYFILISLILPTIFSCKKPLYPLPLSPETALKKFELEEGFTIEIFAAEPYVADPVEMIFDEQGNVFVVEMPDYPYKPEPGKAKGRIRKLIDNNGDGRIDQSITFADSLSEATSLLSWEEGLLVTSAPDILYLKDNDGDFKADTKEVFFTGFFQDNSEAQITNLRFNVDNWVYAANFNKGGDIQYLRQPELPTLKCRGDFRFRLDQHRFENATGPTQFGQAINDWGHRFATQNTTHIQHAVIPWRYLNRHPHLASKQGMENISDHNLEMYQLTPPPYWRAERTRRRLKLYERQNNGRIEYAEDHFTGCSGGTFYGGDAFPAPYQDAVFTGDVAGNLIHLDLLIPKKDSPTYTAKRREGEGKEEFLATTDPWFRPANFTVGPDGFLYVIDMYRQHIETPLSIPEDLKKQMDFYNGMQHGRIYRIRPNMPEFQNKEAPKLRQKTSEELLPLLAHPNQWWRLNAQRLLLERGDTSIVPTLKTMFGNNNNPIARLHSLYLLDGLFMLETGLIKSGLQDEHPRIREQAAILSEQCAVCLPQLMALLKDRDIRVAFQATLSLGQFSDNAILPGLAGVWQQHYQKPLFRTAVLSSAMGASTEMLDYLEKQGFFNKFDKDKAVGLKEFAYLLGHRNKEAEVLLLLQLGISLVEKDKQWIKPLLDGLADGLEKSVTTFTDNALYQKLWNQLKAKE